MSPLANAPNRGYGDWQRIVDWDSPILFHESGVTHNADFATPVMDVSRFAYLGGIDFVQVNNCAVAVAWFADAGATELVGERVFILGMTMQTPAQYRMPNLGPFVQLQYLRIAGVSFTHSCFLFGTNRQHPLEAVPAIASFLLSASGTVANGFSVQGNPENYYAGPALAYFSTPAANWSLQFKTIDSNNASYTFDTIVTTGNNTRFTTVVPFGYWFVSINNQSGASGNFSLVMSASETGST